MDREALKSAIKGEVQSSIKKNMNQNLDESFKTKAMKTAGGILGYAGSAAAMGAGALAGMASLSITPVLIGFAGGVTLLAVSFGGIWQIANKIEDREFQQSIKKLHESIRERDGMISTIQGDPDRQQKKELKRLSKEQQVLGEKLNKLANEPRIQQRLSPKEKQEIDKLIDASQMGALTMLQSGM